MRQLVIPSLLLALLLGPTPFLLADEAPHSQDKVSPETPAPGTEAWEAARLGLDDQVLMFEKKIEADPTNPELYQEAADISRQLGLLYLHSGQEDIARWQGQNAIAHMTKAQKLYELRRETQKVQRVQQQLDRLKQTFGTTR